MKHAEILLKILTRQIVPVLEAAAEEERAAAQTAIAGEDLRRRSATHVPRSGRDDAR